MTRTDIVEQIVKETGITKVAADGALKCVIASITKALKKNDSVTIVGFGSFVVSKRAARMGRNPQSGAAIKIKASKTARFRPGKALKDAIK